MRLSTDSVFSRVSVCLWGCVCEREQEAKGRLDISVALPRISVTLKPQRNIAIL